MSSEIWMKFPRLTVYLFSAPFLPVFAAILLVLGLNGVLPFSSVLVVSGAVMVFLPLLGGAVIARRLRDSAKAASREHPSKFLGRWEELVALSYIPYLLGGILVWVVIYLKPNFGQFGLVAAIIELYVVNLNTEFLPLRFWQPKTEEFLRASLKSAVDPERGKRVFSDSTIRHFNTLAHAKRLGVRIKETLNLEVLLFGSEARKTTSTERLLALSEQHDYPGFIDCLVSLASKPPSEILQRDSKIEDLRQHQGAIFGLGITLILSYSTLLQLLSALLGVVLPK